MTVLQKLCLPVKVRRRVRAFMHLCALLAVQNDADFHAHTHEWKCSF